MRGICFPANHFELDSLSADEAKAEGALGGLGVGSGIARLGMWRRWPQMSLIWRLARIVWTLEITSHCGEQEQRDLGG